MKMSKVEENSCRSTIEFAPVYFHGKLNLENRRNAGNYNQSINQKLWQKPWRTEEMLATLFYVENSLCTNHVK